MARSPQPHSCRRSFAAAAAAAVCGHLDRCARPCTSQPSTDGTDVSGPCTCGGWRPPSGALLASLSRAGNDDAHRKYGVAPSLSTDLAIDHSRHHLRHAAWPAVASWSPGGRRGPHWRDGTHGFRPTGGRLGTCRKYAPQQKKCLGRPSHPGATVPLQISTAVVILDKGGINVDAGESGGKYN